MKTDSVPKLDAKARAQALKADPSFEPDAYDVPEFCVRHRISRAYYYLLKARGEAPTELHIGRRRLITPKAAADWRSKRERVDA